MENFIWVCLTYYYKGDMAAIHGVLLSGTKQKSMQNPHSGCLDNGFRGGHFAYVSGEAINMKLWICSYLHLSDGYILQKKLEYLTPLTFD